jgi:hypothetical protein
MTLRYLPEISNDPRVKRLAAGDRWAYIVLLSLDDSYPRGVASLQQAAIDAALGFDYLTARSAIRRLANAGLVDPDTGAPIGRGLGAA